VMLICLARLPQHLVPRVKGGRPGTEHNGEMYADYLVEMTVDGQIVWQWRTWEHLVQRPTLSLRCKTRAKRGPMPMVSRKCRTVTLC
jgi:hypothetical protein